MKSHTLCHVTGMGLEWIAWSLFLIAVDSESRLTSFEIPLAHHLIRSPIHFKQSTKPTYSHHTRFALLILFAFSLIDTSFLQLAVDWFDSFIGMSLPPPHPSTIAGATGSTATSGTNALESSSAVTSSSSTILSSSTLTSFPAWDQPPQASYGWFVDVPPPRGPFFWPIVPEGYKLRQQQQKGSTNNTTSTTTTSVDPAIPTNIQSPKSAPPATSTQESPPPPSASTEEFNLAHPPQLVWGWFCAALPPQPPYLWPAIPEGYVLMRIDEVDTTTTSTTLSANSTLSTNATTANFPQRASSNIQMNPLPLTSTFPAPQPIATQPLQPPLSSSPTPFSPFIPPTFSPPPMSSTPIPPTATINDQDTNMADSAVETKPARKRGRK